MSLVVEDGTVVANANAYASETTIIAYAAARGVTIATSAAAEQLGILAGDYFASLNWQGNQVEFGVQTMDFPRENVYIEGNLLPDDEIPQRLINGFCQLCMELNAGISPNETITAANQVKSKKFAVFAIEYMSNSIDSPILTKVNDWIAPLLESGAGGFNFKVSRAYG